MQSRFSATTNLKQLKKAAFISCLSLGFSFCSNHSAIAQSFDTSSMAVDSAPQAAVSSTGSNGASGDINRTSYKTGEAPASAGLSGNTSGFSGKQLSGNGTHLALPYAGTGGLAPVFGLGNQISGNGQFTTVLNDPIRLGSGVGIDPTTGMIVTRTGTTVTTVGGLNGGNPYGNVNSLGSNAAVLGAESALLNSSLSGSFFNGSLFSGF